MRAHIDYIEIPKDVAWEKIEGGLSAVPEKSPCCQASVKAATPVKPTHSSIYGYCSACRKIVYRYLLETDSFEQLA